MKKFVCFKNNAYTCSGFKIITENKYDYYTSQNRNEGLS